MKFSEEGLSSEVISTYLEEIRKDDADWRTGKVPLYVYKGSDVASEIGQFAFQKFFNENALGARRAFPSLQHLEAEVVAMGLELLNGPEDATGNMTSGGSESIFMAVRAAREYKRKNTHNERLRGNLVLPESAHPAFAKAAAVMDLEERRIPVQSNFRADPTAIDDAIDQQTIMIVGSAPCFPFGVIDPIEELGEISLRRSVWLHVDACVGGYLAPFVRDLGYTVPKFEFTVPGVSSISADLHKFGFCPKPASTIFYRSEQLAQNQIFDLDVWPSGRFTTSTLTGTRPGGAVAGAWATMKALGRNGYRQIASQLMQMRDTYLHDLRVQAGYESLGDPHLSIIAFHRNDTDILKVAEIMKASGWVPGLVKKPIAFHLVLSMLHAEARINYIRDLSIATTAVINNSNLLNSSEITY